MVAHTTAWWRPTTSLSRVLMWMLGAQAALSLSWLTVDLTRWLDLFDRAVRAAMDSRTGDFNRLMTRMSEVGNALSQLAGIAMIATFVLVVVWTWRSRSNLQVLGRTGARLSPGWTIGMWFIPLANLVLPYVVFQDLWRSSDPRSEPGDAWRRFDSSPVITAAWLLWVVSALATPIALIVVATSSARAADLAWLLVTGYAAAAAAYLLAIPAIRAITARQQALQMTLRVVGSGPLDRILASGTRPGWHPDPHGEHDARYWDGRAWTEHVVSHEGPTTAPVVPADWHPDPTGRYEWRFWDGYAWTEHVARDGELSTDPV